MRACIIVYVHGRVYVRERVERPCARARVPVCVLVHVHGHVYVRERVVERPCACARIPVCVFVVCS